MKKTTAAEMVQMALNKKKIKPEQTRWAMEYANRDPESFQVFVSKAVTIPDISVPGHKPGVIDETQRQINKMCGVDDKTYQKYGPHSSANEKDNAALSEPQDDTQRLIGSLLSIDDGMVTECNSSRSGDSARDPQIDEAQRLINILCGVDAATFRRYNSNQGE